MTRTKCLIFDDTLQRYFKWQFGFALHNSLLQETLGFKLAWIYVHIFLPHWFYSPVLLLLLLNVVVYIAKTFESTFPSVFVDLQSSSIFFYLSLINSIKFIKWLCHKKITLIHIWYQKQFILTYDQTESNQMCYLLLLLFFHPGNILELCEFIHWDGFIFYDFDVQLREEKKNVTPKMNDNIDLGWCFFSILEWVISTEKKWKIECDIDKIASLYNFDTIQ